MTSPLPQVFLTVFRKKTLPERPPPKPLFLFSCQNSRKIALFKKSHMYKKARQGVIYMEMLSMLTTCINTVGGWI